MATITTTARLRYLRMSPRKVRLLIDLIRGKKAGEAAHQLQFSAKTAAKPVLKLLKSAMANAEHNHGMAGETLIVTKAFVDGGPILYRAMPRAQGRSAPIRKRTAHITIELTGEGKGKADAATVAEKTEKEDTPAEKPKKVKKAKSKK